MVGTSQRAAALSVAVLILVVSCSSGTTDDTNGPAAAVNEPATTMTDQQQTAEPASTTTVAAPSAADLTKCEDPAEEFAFETAVESEIPGADGSDTLYSCVEVPVDVEEFTVELTGLADNLDLYLGYPDLATLVDGGFGLKFSTAGGTTDEW